MSSSSRCTDDEGADHVRTPLSHPAAPETVSGRRLEDIALLDLLVLQDLESQLAKPAVARNFALDYIEIWEQRYLNLAAAITGQDRTAALDAAISLKIGSAMVGGLRLAGLAEDIENLVRSGSWDQGQLLLAKVGVLGRQTVAQLRQSYLTAE
jgi:hypothetical protein